MATSRIPGLPATAHGPAAVAVVVVAATVAVGLVVAEPDGWWPVVLLLGAPFGFLWGAFQGLVTLPVYRLTGYGYGPPELTPATAVGTVRDAWRFHVAGAILYSLLSNCVGVFLLGVGQSPRLPDGSARVLAFGGGLVVGTCFVLAQVWRTRAVGADANRRALLTWVVLGALLALPALLIGTYGVLLGAPDVT